MYNLQTDDWRKIFDAELKDLYSGPDILEEIKKRKLQQTGHVWRERKDLVSVILGKDPNEKR